MEQKTSTEFVIITYTLNTKNGNSDIVRFHRKLYGYTDYSQHGKYQYKRPGLLDNIPHLNPSRSVLIVKKLDAGKLVNFIKKTAENVFVRDIILEDGDWGGLG